MQTVAARLDIEVFVDCPHCDHLIDLRSENDTNGVMHDDCGDILKEACPQHGHWSDSHEKFELDEVECSSCKGVFNVRTIEW